MTWPRTVVLRFNAETTCDGSYTLIDGHLDVSFGECTASSVMLSHPMFRSATAHLSRWTDRLLINGDAGVFALAPAP